MRFLPYRRLLILSLTLFLLSWANLRLGIFIGQSWPKGDGYPQAEGHQEDLFRFDAFYYLDLAENGYSLPHGVEASPNLVFAPLYPLLVNVVSTLSPFDEIQSGFLLNKVLLFLSLLILLNFLEREFDPRRALILTFAMITSAGSYSLHAFYSEATMLFCLSLCLLSWQRQNWWLLTLSCAALGATRVAALPIIAVYALALCVRSWQLKRLQLSLYALLTFTGAMLYLGYIFEHFGNPLTLFLQIQKTSWGLFHPDVDLKSLLSGLYLFQYTSDAISFGWTTLTRIQTLNLIWMGLTLSSAAYTLMRYRRRTWTYVFLAYAILLYVSGIGSEYLISTHRFALFMLPIFLGLADIDQWALRKWGLTRANIITGLLLGLNLSAGLLHTAHFNQGDWFWF